MNKKISALNKRFNIAVFVFATFIYSFLSTTDAFIIFRDLSAAFLFGIVLFITISIPSKRKHYHIGVYILIAGISAWLIWSIYSFCTGIVMLADRGAVYKISSRIMFIITILVTVKIIYYYDLKITFIKTILLGCGLRLLLAYCMHFDGLQFLGSLQNIMINAGRYRNAHGLGHPNHAGFSSMLFIIMSIIYYEVVKKELQERTSRKNDYSGHSLLLRA